MRVYSMLALFFVLTMLSCSGATRHLETTPDSPAAGLPAIPGLDALHSACAVQGLDILTPMASAHTAVSGPNLAFNPQGSAPAWALYAIDANIGVLNFASLESTAPLWLLAADYDDLRWEHSSTPGETLTLVDLALAFMNYTSPADMAYLAVVCPAGQTAELTGLSVDYTPGSGLPLTVDDTIDGRLIISWMDLGGFDYFELYRSTLEVDDHPYLIATVDSGAVGEIFYHDVIPTQDEEWVCANNDNGTPADLTDDFPSLAPGVDYYYQFIPYTAPGVPGPASEIESGSVDWGDRRTTRRALPSTRSDIAVFADQLLPNLMTAAQIQWCAQNLVGTQKILQGQAEDFRLYNDDFMVIGYHLSNGAGVIGNVHGDDWDNDIDWPYVEAHDDWFVTLASSTLPENRVRQLDWFWWLMDPQSQWEDYLAANLLTTLSEDHFDGWFIDSASQPWNTDPYPWWPSGETQFGYWTPRLNQMLETICTAADAHPLQPLIIPNAGQYITTLSDIKYYGDTWACDGIMIEGHAHQDLGVYYSEADWVLEHNQILDHQANGLATILQTRIDPVNTQDRLFVFGSYLLVRGEHTYINWLGKGVVAQVGQWYPEFDLDEDAFPWGMPIGPDPTTMADLWQADPGVYRRGFSAGFVLVNPSDEAVTYNFPWPVQLLSVGGGGNITEAGTTVGSYSWNAHNGDYEMPANSALIVLDVFG